jgi:UDP-N-acetylglucosamine 2-epimerase (non-hydrolysing)/GDP/UDP-N,N'-diacetylbacillosamine 2-epimerase (hydrolysing)
MGEHPDRVFNFGAPGLDGMLDQSFLSRSELQQALGMQLGSPLFLVTYHPVTLQSESPARPMAELLAALDRFPNATVVFTYPNADTDGRVLIEMIEDHVRGSGGRARAFTSLGRSRYLSVMAVSDVVIGNSSSGIIEAPLFKKPTVDIGDRQKGRLRAESVIHCEERRDDIAKSIERAMSDEFARTLRGTVSLYGVGGASRKIAQVLATVDLSSLVAKEFHDL